MHDVKRCKNCVAPYAKATLAALCLASLSTARGSPAQTDPQLSEIVVTDSRTAPSVEQSTIPVLVLDQADIQRSGIDATSGRQASAYGGDEPVEHESTFRQFRQ